MLNHCVCDTDHESVIKTIVIILLLLYASTTIGIGGGGAGGVVTSNYFAFGQKSFQHAKNYFH